MSMYPAIDRDALLRCAETSLILTVNQRLARSLHEAYARRCLEQGLLAWQKPAIVAWEHWQLGLLQELELDDRLLSDFQELQLWQEAIAASVTPEERLQLQLPATARLARDAHRLLCRYDSDFAPHDGSADHCAFLTWREAWCARLAALEALDRARCDELLRRGFAAGELSTPQHVVLAGFDDFYPQQRALLAQLEACGSTLRAWSGGGLPGAVCRRAAAADPADEVARCARQVRQWLYEDVESIGVVVAEPHLYRALLERELLAELAPRALLTGDGVEGLFSFSLGGALADEGIVACALQLLSLGDPLHYDEISFLLRTPWLGDPENDSARRVRDAAELRRSAQVYWPLHKLRGFARARGRGRGRTAPVTVLGTCVGALEAGLRQRRRRRPAGEWASQLEEFLTACGWPGARTLNSRDYQAREEFNELFAELASLERLGGLLTRTEAVAFIQRRCQERTFQIKETTGRVQVLGLLEAAGLRFDRLWVLGLHDGSFPAPPRPNPFIPVPLQRAAQMPHADAERELAFSAQVAERLFTSAYEVIASHPCRSDDTERLPSSFIADFAPSAPPSGASSHPFQLIAAAAPKPEALQDAQAPPVVANTPVSGGTGLLKDQALCPFRAFVHHRLRGEAPDSLDIGLNSLQRGTLAHRMLELFWRQVGDQAALLQLTPQQCSALLREGAEQALAALERANRRDLEADLRGLECERLVELGREWLDVERQRAPFRVHELEVTCQCPLGGLVIRTQVDRIDELAAGGLAIIDYKTGRPDPTRWFAQRLSEPQLPIYAHGVNPERLAAVLFGQVRRGDCRYRGVSSRDDEIPNVPDRGVTGALEAQGFDFAGLLAHWRTALPQLGDAFIAGEAQVDPLDGAETCRYCDCHSLCRIYEQRAQTGEGDDG